MGDGSIRHMWMYDRRGCRNTLMASGLHCRRRIALLVSWSRFVLLLWLASAGTKQLLVDPSYSSEERHNTMKALYGALSNLMSRKKKKRVIWTKTKKGDRAPK